MSKFSRLVDRVLLALFALLGMFLACSVFGGCLKPGPPAYPSLLADVTSYRVVADQVTPGGIQYGGALDPAALDRATASVAACLANVPEPTAEQRAAMECMPGPLRRVVDAARFDVFVPSDWTWSCSGREQVFPCRVDPKGCLDKGLQPTEECPCRCRATVQGNRTVVTAPNLRLYPGELVRLVTGCNNPWAPGSPLIPCMTPP